MRVNRSTGESVNRLRVNWLKCRDAIHRVRGKTGESLNLRYSPIKM